MVVAKIFYFHPYLGKSSNLTSIFLDGLKPPASICRGMKRKELKPGMAQVVFPPVVIGHMWRSDLNSHYFHVIGEGHQPNSGGVYSHYKDSLLKVGSWSSQKKRDF